MRAAASASIAACILAGCTVYDGQFAWTDGWKRVRVIEIKPADQIQSSGSPDCRSVGETNAARLFAVVDVPQAGRVRRSIIAVPEDFKYDPASRYIANLWTCQPTLRVSGGEGKPQH